MDPLKKIVTFEKKNNNSKYENSKMEYTGWWFSKGIPVSSINKSDRHYNWNSVESGIKHHKPNKLTATVYSSI